MRIPLMLILACPAVAQSTIHVPADHPTIQQAILAASDGDVVLVAPGTYAERIDLLGKTITLASSAGPAATTIDGTGAVEWIDYPFRAVVRMDSGENAGTVIDGFTITGGDSTFTYDGFGVYCRALSPTIRGCVIQGNSGGGGVYGDPLLEGCVVRDNDTALTSFPGGGVRGQATIVGCVIEGNHSGDRGGGVYADGPCAIVDTVIDGNRSGNGFDGYSGGGVYGPATLIDCQITRNEAGHHQSGGPPDVLGSGVDGAIALHGCTVAYNSVFPDPPVPEPSGGVRGNALIENSILFGNEGQDVALGSTPAISWSIVGSGWSGLGVQSEDPLFLDPMHGDFTLSFASPAIDAGNPLGPKDPDGSTADLGAYPFHQVEATAVVRIGSGVNPVAYSSLSDPKLGATWSAKVDATLFGFPLTAALVAGTLAPIAPAPTAFGELLIHPGSPQVLALVAAPSGGVASFTVPIPPQDALIGLLVATQAVGVGASVQLANAVDLTLGTL